MLYSIYHKIFVPLAEYMKICSKGRLAQEQTQSVHE